MREYAHFVVLKCALAPSARPTLRGGLKDIARILGAGNARSVSLVVLDGGTAHFVPCKCDSVCAHFCALKCAMRILRPENARGYLRTGLIY